MYKIGIKRRFLPGYRKFLAVDHKIERMDGANFDILVVYLENGGFLSIPEPHKVEIRTYGDWTLHKEALSLLKLKSPRPPMEIKANGMEPSNGRILQKVIPATAARGSDDSNAPGIGGGVAAGHPGPVQHEIPAQGSPVPAGG